MRGFLDTEPHREVSSDTFTALRIHEAIVDSFREPQLPLNEEEKERFFQGTTDLGFESAEEEIDEVLYGEDHEDPV